MNIPTLFKITPEPFGLDLSDRSVKIVKLSRRKGGFFVESFGEENLAEGLMKDGEVVLEEKLAQKINLLVNNLKLGKFISPYVACSLPEQKSFLHVVQLPQMNEGEVFDAIRYELEAHIPLKLSDVYFDWQIIPPLHKSISHFDILISAAPRDLVDSYVRLFTKAGLIPFSFELESSALARCLIWGGITEKPILLVDLGEACTSFIIYAGHGVRFTSSIQISGNLMTENIARDLKLDVKEAERFKKDTGLDQEGNKRVFEAIVPVITDLKEQIRRYLDFYAGHESHVHDGKSGVSKILLSGGGAHLKEIDKYLSASLKMPVEIADPFINLDKVSAKPRDFDAIRYATALGLAQSEAHP